MPVECSYGEKEEKEGERTKARVNTENLSLEHPREKWIRIEEPL